MRIRYAIGQLFSLTKEATLTGFEPSLADFVKLRDFRSNLQESAR